MISFRRPLLPLHLHRGAVHGHAREVLARGDADFEGGHARPVERHAEGLRRVRHGEAAAPWRGFMAGLRGLPEAWRRRKLAQAQRKVSSAEIARAMTWSPIGLWKRRVFIQPLPGPRPDGP